MRLIDADALIEGYKHMGYDPTEHPEESHMEGWCKGFNAAVDHCLHHVVHAPTIEPMRWISAFDKSPDKDGEYLTVIKDHEWLFVEITEFVKDRWVVVYGNDDDYHEVSNVIAWMPIPAVVYERGAE